MEKSVSFDLKVYNEMWVNGERRKCKVKKKKNTHTKHNLYVFRKTVWQATDRERGWKSFERKGSR